jgi:hypothetical protein
MQVSFLGTILFVLSTIGRFEEHKIDAGFRNHYNRQINLLTQLSNVSVTYFIYLIALLIAQSYYKDPLVVENLKTVLFSLVMVSSLYLLFVIVRTLVFEDIVDALEIDWFFKQYGLSDSLKNLLGEKK